MFSGLEKSQLAGALEAMLFVSDEPVGTIALADMIECEPEEVERALVSLRAQLKRENRGIQLREVAGGWRLFTHPAYHELIEKYVISWDTRKLSQAAIETLAVVAYGQPITRAQVAAVRGVNSDSSINSLVEKGLVREAGTSDAPGNPTLYATTRAFLEKFGLRCVQDLPDLEQFAPDEATRIFIRERLSATSEENTQLLEDTLEGEGFDAGEGVSADDAVGADVLDRVSLEDDGQELEELTSPESLLMQAAASSFGLVEKIDFDKLNFETDDE